MTRKSEGGIELPEIGPVFAGLFERARPYLQTRDNEEHTRISYGYAERLLRTGADPEIVLPAILLHDIGWSRVPEELQLSAFGPNATRPELRDLHEEEGAKLAEEILRGLDYPPGAIEHIARIIAGHDSKSTSDSLEEAVVKDADKLFRFSRRGFRIIARWYEFDRLEFLGRLEEKIPEWFLTALGAELAGEEAAARRAELSARRVEPEG